MILYILRGTFIILVAAVTALYLLPNQWGADLNFPQFVILMMAALAVAGLIIAIDVASPRKRLSAISGVFLGLIAGLVAAYALSFVVDLIGLLAPRPRGVTASAFANLLQGVKVLIGLISCYVAMSLALQTKDDFRFVIPYVEFAKEVRGNRPTILDTSVIIDGRILDIVQTNVLQGTIIVPRFVLQELQHVADSADRLRRERGRRGLDVLQKLQDGHLVEVHIDETDPPGSSVDQKLLALAERQQARLMTNDFNLHKVATLRGMDVINLNDLAQAMRPVVLPGEPMSVKVIKPGEAPTQGVGYLEDGTMVVVEGARHRLGETLDITVTSTLQTKAGRMVFGKIADEKPDRSDAQTATASTPPADDSGAPVAASATDAAQPRSTPSRVRPRGVGRNPRRG